MFLEKQSYVQGKYNGKVTRQRRSAYHVACFRSRPENATKGSPVFQVTGRLQAEAQGEGFTRTSLSLRRERKQKP